MGGSVGGLLLILKSLKFLKFGPASFALFNSEAHTAGYIGPVWSEMNVRIQLN